MMKGRIAGPKATPEGGLPLWDEKIWIQVFQAGRLKGVWELGWQVGVYAVLVSILL